jgi:hypothetical protein
MASFKTDCLKCQGYCIKILLPVFDLFSWLGKCDLAAQPTLLQVQTPRYYIPTIFWLSNLDTVYSRAAGTIMDSSLHVYSHFNANWLQVMEQGWTETQEGNIIICFIDPALVKHLHSCCRNNSNKQWAVCSIMPLPQSFWTKWIS